MLSIARRAAAVASTAVLALASAVVVTGVVLARLDVVRFATVRAGSMEPGIGTGSVIAGTPLAGDEVRVGDVVMFVPPEPYNTYGGKPVVHRVIQVADVPGVLQVSTRATRTATPTPGRSTRGGPRSTSTAASPPCSAPSCSPRPRCRGRACRP